MRSVTIAQVSSSGLRALIVTPEAGRDTDAVLLFLHGMREAGSSPNELPKVCIHQSPPWHAMAGHITDVVVVAPQAPPVPDESTWNWRGHIVNVAQFVRANWSGRRVLATGFSRGGLGVLQLLAADATLIDRWAVIDPQPPADQDETASVLAAAGTRPGWVRYGAYRNRSRAWTRFAEALDQMVPESDRDTTTDAHGELALRAYAGDPLSAARKQNLYEFLQVGFAGAP